MIVRSETPADIAAIRAIEEAAFPQSVEAKLVDDLRDAGDSVLSLVAVEHKTIIGHAMFSRLQAPFPALALAPVAVLPDRQRMGVGSRLIREGIACSEAAGWLGIFVLGDPAFYGRFGFDAGKASGFTSPYAGPHWMALSLGSSELPATAGSIQHAPAFANLA
jgi:putative acetyltransferase